jgi:hypothetical protein
MKLFLLLFCLMLFNSSCSPMKDSAKADYPYLKTGDSFYADIHSYDMTPSTSMREIYDNSKFGELPEFVEAENNGNVIFKKDRVDVHGDGGFSGLSMEREGSFPWRLKLIFPDFESRRILTLQRQNGGWIVAQHEQVQ